MGDNKHKADYERVSGQNSFTDFARGIEEHPQGGFYNNLVYGALRPMVEATPYGRAMHGRTHFDDYDLNKMVDLVEQTKPEDLESSGKALWDARDAISAAAKELDGHIEKVHWVGESGDAFREWGRSLVKSTNALSDFAGGAGDQITAAAVGLASVRSAMPSRDTRPDRKRPDRFTEAEKAADKEEYADAVRVEKDRQEAINQMNRLSSYYAVAKEQLHGLNAQPPQFTAMPNVGVPRPKVYVDDTGGGVGSAAEDTRTSRPAPSDGHHATVGSTGHVAVRGDSDAPAPVQHVTGDVPRPAEPVGTNIDSVGTLPPVTTPVTGHTPPATGPSAPGADPTGVFGKGYVPNGLPGRATGGAGGARTPASAQGRAGRPGLGNSGAGRSAGRSAMSQVGRAAATGQSIAKGSSTGTGSSPTGRGVAGGTSRTGATPTSRTGGGPAAGAGRANGIVGGRPSSPSGASGKNAPRMPRGTVIGAGGEAESRPRTGATGQRGVFGATESTGRQGSSSRTPASRGGTAASEAVTGRPVARESAGRAERNGMTRGGTGLVRGPGRQGETGEKEKECGAPRPDYLVEDEETHLPTKPRRDVPPVIH